jgi:bifunctional DNA-binding transcriptional regulator/antitoxin component of YhaV-PrlF toxin-antitoxin module
MVKVVVNNGQYKITIPKELAEAKGWTSKTRLRFIEDAEGTVILKEIEPVKRIVKRTKRGRKK